MEHYSAIEKSEIMKFQENGWNWKKNYSKGGNPRPQRTNDTFLLSYEDPKFKKLVAAQAKKQEGIWTVEYW